MKSFGRNVSLEQFRKFWTISESSLRLKMTEFIDGSPWSSNIFDEVRILTLWNVKDKSLTIVSWPWENFLEWPKVESSKWPKIPEFVDGSPWSSKIFDEVRFLTSTKNSWVRRWVTMKFQHFRRYPFPMGRSANPHFVQNWTNILTIHHEVPTIWTKCESSLCETWRVNVRHV